MANHVHVLAVASFAVASCAIAVADDREAKFYTLPDHAQHFAPLPDNKRVACNATGNVWIFDLETGKSSGRLFEYQFTSHITLTGDGKSVFITGRNTAIRPLDPAEREILAIEVEYSYLKEFPSADGKRVARRYVGPGLALPVLTADGKRLFAHTPKSDIAVWDVPAGKWIKTIAGNGTPVNKLAVSTDGERLVAATPKELIAWDVKTEKRLFTKPLGRNWAAAGYDFAPSIHFLPGGHTAFCLSSDKLGDDVPSDRVPKDFCYQLLDCDTGECRVLARSMTHKYFGSVLAPDGKHFFLPGSPYVHVISTETGKEVATYRQQHDFPAIIAAVSPDGQYLFLGNGGPKLARVPMSLVMESKPLTTLQDLRDKP